MRCYRSFFAKISLQTRASETRRRKWLRYFISLDKNMRAYPSFFYSTSRKYAIVRSTSIVKKPPLVSHTHVSQTFFPRRRAHQQRNLKTNCIHLLRILHPFISGSSSWQLPCKKATIGSGLSCVCAPLLLSLYL